MAPDGRSAGRNDGSDPLLGLVVANHRVLARIGQGGMGAVYLAQHTILGRNAAVKVLLPEFSNNQDFVSRFFNEARATAQLHYPGFVQIFDSGTLPDGSAYLVMEYLRGVNLAASIAYRRKLAVAETLAVLRDVAGSVAYAHKHGIVHRDLKPDNVFLAVARDEATGCDQVTIKVLDFGIAKLSGMAGGSGAGSSRTRTGALMGTPLYMSPEQCRGVGQVDHRTDIYSLGCIAFNSLAGAPPFPFDGFGEIIAAHLSRPPAPLRTQVAWVPEALESFVLCLLAKNPAERPQTMDAVVTALDQLRQGEGGAVPDLLDLVPPAALAQDPAAYTSLPGTRVATTPLPNTALPGMGTPTPAGKSGGTRWLAAGAGYAEGPRSVSTLGGAAMPLDDMAPVPRLRGGRGWAIGAGVLAGVALTVGLVFAFGGVGTHDGREASRRERPIAVDESPLAVAAPAVARAASAPAAAAAPMPDRGSEPAVRPTVSVRISSSPAGASVIDEKSGRILGDTPLDRTFPHGDGVLDLLVRKRGFQPKSLSVNLDQDVGLTVILEKRAAAVRVPADSPDDDKRKL